MRHHSGSEEYPLRGVGDFLKDLDSADHTLAVQKLQVEALIRIAEALGPLGNIPIDAEGGLMVALSNPAYSTLKVRVKREESED